MNISTLLGKMSSPGQINYIQNLIQFGKMLFLCFPQCWKTSLFFLTLFSLISISPQYGSLFGANKIALVESTASPEYRLAANGFKVLVETKSPRIRIDNWLLEGKEGTEARIWQEVAESQPALIVTVGTQATKSALEHIESIPIVFTMTWEDFTRLPSDIPDAQKPIGGVSISIPIEHQLKILFEALPMVRRLGILYSSSQENLFNSALEYSKQEKINLIGSGVGSYKDVPLTLKKIISSIDGLILPPDANIYHPDALQFILHECFQKGIPVMAFSEQLAVAGAPLTIGLDYKDIGRQTAELAIQILSNQNLNRGQREFPRTVLLYINEAVSLKMGLYFSRKILDKAIIVGKGNPEQ
ncbi:MAG: ABC transporter substrate binding protein [Candidatus Glassbacteria bacterium]